LFLVLGHVLQNLLILLKPGGGRELIAINLVLRQQLLVLNRGRKRSPNIPAVHRLLLVFWTQLINPGRIERLAIALRPSTLFKSHIAFVKKKYRDLFSSKTKREPGPKGPSKELIQAIVEFKRRNPRCGCPRIAQQISDTFGIELSRDEVLRVLLKYLKPTGTDDGPSWLNTLGHSVDSLWSIDLFRTESIHLKTHWVLVVMDQYSRRIIGFAVQAVAVDGPALCRMFNEAIAGSEIPTRLSHDNDPLFSYLQSVPIEQKALGVG
jgi:putative transposase